MGKEGKLPWQADLAAMCVTAEIKIRLVGGCLFVDLRGVREKEAKFTFFNFSKGHWQIMSLIKMRIIDTC